MPVKRLKSLEETERGLWFSPDDPRLWPTIVELWAAAERLAPRRFPPGVRKFRSVEAMNAAREEADRAFARRRANRETPTVGEALDGAGGTAGGPRTQGQGVPQETTSKA